MFHQHHFTRASLGFALRVVPSHRAISTRARALWQHERRPTGDDLAIWLRAERQLRSARPEPTRSLRQQVQDRHRPGVDLHRSPTSV